MSRFHIYAPFIKHLDLDSYFDPVSVHNWEPLISYSQTIQLLPNLVEFSCSQFELRSCFVFLSGLTQVLRIFKESDFDGIGTSELLGHIASKCPNICELQYQCELDEPIDGDSAEDTSLRTFASLAGFHNFCRLTSGLAIIQSSALRLLAQLPNLADLSIRAESDTSPWDSSLCEQLRPGSFPALKSLSLDFETPRDVKRFWELVPLAGLEAAYISMALASDKGASEFIPTLCQASPNITSLRLTFPSQSDLDEEDREVYSISIDMFEHLARLPLDNTLSLGHARLNFDDTWTRIAQTWPSLREIDIVYHPIPLDELTLLSATLQNLYCVQCDFDLEQAVQTVEHNWQPVVGCPFYPGLHSLIIKEFELREHASSFRYDLSDLARTFAYFWPNICVESVENSSDDFETDAWKYKQALFDMFQKLIRAHVQLFHP